MSASNDQDARRPDEEPDLSTAEIRSRAAQGVLLLALRGLFIRLIGLVGYLVLARLLKPGDFGVAAFGLSFAFVGHFLADVGVGAALIRQPQAPSRAEYASVVGLQLAVTGAAAVATGVWAALSGNETALVTTMYVTSVACLAFRVPAVTSLERQLRYRPAIMAELIEVLVYNAWAIGTVLAGFGVYGMASGSVVKTLVGTSVLYTTPNVPWVRPALHLGRVRHLLSFGVAFQANAALGIGRDQALNVGTAAISGYHVLGLWAIASRLTSAPFFVFESLWRVSFPAMARLLATGQRLDDIMRRGVRIAAAVAGLLLAPLAVGAPAVLDSALGSSWNDAARVAPMIFFGMAVVAPISVVANGYLYARGEASAVLRTYLAATVTVVAVSLIGLRVVGYVALGWGQLAAALVEAYLLSRAVRRFSGVAIGGRVAAATGSWLIAFAAGHLILLTDLPSPADALAGSALAAIVYVASIRWLDREASRGAWSMLRRLSRFPHRTPAPTADGLGSSPLPGATFPGEDLL